MLVIGLTGGIGSGKTTVANLFAQKGVTIIDTDKLSRDLTLPDSPALKQISDKFGREILLANGALDRARLRKIIFADETNRLWLEQLLHPLIRIEMKRQAEESESPYCIVVIPLLFETDRNPLIQRVLVVDASEESQLTRTLQRDGSSDAEVAAILKTQVDREKRLGLADDVIRNDGGLDELILQVKKLHEFYLSITG
ncbi:MAG: dephospho-CoA kinase [Gammaproteobacteria bacterium]